MKLADYIYEEVLGMEGKDEVLSCSEFNRRSLEYAASLASETALARMAERGSLRRRSEGVLTFEAEPCANGSAAAASAAACSLPARVRGFSAGRRLALMSL